MGTAMPLVVISFICATVFIGIGIFALKKKTPMHFWSGTRVKTEEISDVKAYNKANGTMWIAYGSTFILSAILSILFEVVFIIFNRFFYNIQLLSSNFLLKVI
ncbi:hypothetical protein [Anaerosalibacter massiliensis]|uniref:DUF3784 domain-containing protein n=1 Tax=Anaerosalibacter massiliensis TaxID=1347392 RepID=A0A9X2MFP4_9FIRM|nr:hypothetical protein [Anaerosalibacter massiliensis]MCR2044167.1 hypothetical protein [Anaerosalibacter massiliensis]